MKPANLSFFLAAGLTLVICLRNGAAAAEKSSDHDGVAVVELFTSEGCSSCPPADAALGDLIRDSKGKRVFALAFHVGYWDDLGWADPFADAAYTNRQRDYGRAFNLRGVYTPQAVVNGRNEFLGSNRATLKSAVADALATPAIGTLSATAKQTEAGIELVITAESLPAGTIVNAALVESGLSSSVRRGENAGKKLPHEKVVRSFKSLPLDGDKASITLAIPRSVHADHASIVLYAQQPADGRVVAATEVAFPR